MAVYGHPDVLKARLVSRIRTKRQPTMVARFLRWLKGTDMYHPNITKLNLNSPRNRVVTAYCQRCSDFYDPDLGCRCLMVIPPYPQPQEVVYAALAPEFENETPTNQMP